MNSQGVQETQTIKTSQVAIDFETANNSPTSACAIGMTKVINGQITDTYYTLIRPPSEKFLYTDIHHITWDMVKDAPTYLEAWPKIAEFLEDAALIIAHNASFDRNVLRACCAHYSIVIPKIPYACTVKGARKAFGLPRNRLNILCEHLGIKLEHHNAGSDANAAAQIYIKCKNHGVTDMQMHINR